MQKQQDTRLAENKIRKCKQTMGSWSWHHWQLVLEQLLWTGCWSCSYLWFGCTAYSVCCALTMPCAWLLTSAKTRCLSRPDALVNISVLWQCHVHGHLLQQKHGSYPVQMPLSTYLCFALSWGLNVVGKQQQLGLSTASHFILFLKWDTRPQELF